MAFNRDLLMRAPRHSPLRSVPSATGAIARLVCGRLRQAGLPLASLLSSAGLSIERIDDVNARLEVTAQVKLLKIAAEQLQDGLLGFHLGREFELGQRTAEPADRARVRRVLRHPASHFLGCGNLRRHNRAD